MLLSDEQVKAYHDDGCLLLPCLFSPPELDVLKAAAAEEMRLDSERRVLEKAGNVVRSVYGCHAVHDVFRRLACHPRIVEPAMQLLGGEIYVHQFKLNAKAAFGGDVWQWHQDFIFWLHEDGVPAPALVNSVVFFDEVTEFNGPLFLIAGSHQEGVLGPRALEGQPEGYQDAPAWISNLTADLKYTVPREVVAAMVRKHRLLSAKGGGGSLLFFHPNLLHGSTPNISPFDRSLAIITYNRVDNPPPPREDRRPWFLSARDTAAIAPVADGALLP